MSDVRGRAKATIIIPYAHRASKRGNVPGLVDTEKREGRTYVHGTCGIGRHRLASPLNVFLAVARGERRHESPSVVRGDVFKAKVEHSLHE